MANILKKVLHSTASKSPQDLVSRTSAAADKLTETASERQQEELSKYLTYMKVQLGHICYSASSTMSDYRASSFSPATLACGSCHVPHSLHTLLCQ